jgi:hypothetical protein
MYLWDAMDVRVRVLGEFEGEGSASHRLGKGRRARF